MLKRLAWIYNTLFGPANYLDEAEKDAQAYFDRERKAPRPMKSHGAFQVVLEQSGAEPDAAAGFNGED